MDDTNTPVLANLIRQQESLREVIESISSELELRPLLTRIVRHACELLGADRGTIGLVDRERELIRTEAAYRMPPDEIGAEMPAGAGLAGRVYETGQPIILNQYGDLERPLQLELVQDAVIGLPISWRGRMIGFFGIGAAPPRTFSEQDIELLTLLARHAAIAITNAQLYTQAQQSLNETRLLYATSQRISNAMDVEGVIEAYLEQVAARNRYACTIVLYEFNQAGKRVAVQIRGRWAPDEKLHLLDERLPYTEDALDPPLDAGETTLISNVYNDPRVSEELRQIQRQSQRPALAMIPLITNGRRIGLVVLSYPVVHTWPEADLQPYQATAAQLATAIDSRLQQRTLYERGQHIAVLEERQRLARELHDSVTQLIFSMTLIAQAIAPAWQRDPAEGERRINRLLELSQSALAEMRALLAELQPAELQPTESIGGTPTESIGGTPTETAKTATPAERSGGTPTPATPDILRLRKEGLAAVLCDYAARIAGDSLQVEVDADSYRPSQAGPQAAALDENLYRIAQEALNNVVKHAHAAKVDILLTTQNGMTRLRVVDDGRGFSGPIGHARPGGLGLRNMRQRAEILGGILRLDNRPGGGTIVEVTIAGIQK
jgi:signal transduction histidine kinase